MTKRNRDQLGRFLDNNAVLPVALRAWTATQTQPGRRPTKNVKAQPHTTPAQIDPTLAGPVLVVDTETTIDAAQRLTFGSWRLSEIDNAGNQTRLAAGLFYADDLPETDPAGYQALVDYAKAHVADVSPDQEADRTLRLTSRAEFIYRVFFTVAFKARGHVVMFNKPFDLSRLAVDVSDTRGTLRADGRIRNDYAGGFSLQLGPHDRVIFEPRVRVKHIDPRKAFAALTRPRDTEHLRPGEHFRGNFLDLRTWADALSGQAHTLGSACEAFGVEHGKLTGDDGGPVQHGKITEAYIAYSLRDTLATEELMMALWQEHNAHPVLTSPSRETGALAPTQAFSPASVAKAYLRGMGITPPRSRFSIPDEVLGYSMSTFFGGRAEVRIRLTPMPVEVVDFNSMYPTVNALMKTWRLLIAESLTAVEDTAAVRELAEDLALGDLFSADLWPELVGMCQVLPEGDILPVRANYGVEQSYTIGVNPLHADEPLWYTIADVVASKILTGKTPRILRAIRYRPGPPMPGLRRVTLRGTVPVDPYSDDFFVRVVAERQRIKSTDPDAARFLKFVGNTGSYGIFAQVDPEDAYGSQRVTVHDHAGQPRTMTIEHPEVPGEYCFPPIAAAITGAARLMLAMLERCVTDAEGCWVFCDTDSLAIVATADGRLIPCSTADGRGFVNSLTHDQVQGIRNRFAALSPYGDSSTGLLKSETEPGTWCVAISAKRYACYRFDEHGTIQLVKDKWKEHGLGHLPDPNNETDLFNYEPDQSVSDDDEDPMRQTVIRERRWWIGDYWSTVISHIRSGAFDQEPVWPSWAYRPAFHKVTVSTPAIWHLFDTMNAGRNYPDQIKPFGFLIAATDAGYGESKAVPVAPFTTILPAPDHPWIDRVTGLPIKISTEEDESDFIVDSRQRNIVKVKAYADILKEHYLHPEWKFLGPDGQPCGEETRGLLQRRSTTVALINTIGKETTGLDRVNQGLETARTDPRASYNDPNRRLERALVVLRSIGAAEVTRRVAAIDDHNRKTTEIHNSHIRRVLRNFKGREKQINQDRVTPREHAPLIMTERHIRRILNGAAPRGRLRDVLIAIAADEVEVRLRAAGATDQQIRDLKGSGRKHDQTVIIAAAQNRDTSDSEHYGRCGCGCGEPVGGRRRYVDQAHRKRAQRHRATQSVIGEIYQS
jgi:hypothetical protein